MNLRYSISLMLALASSAAFGQNQEQIVDQIAAVAGNKIVLKSE
ncbi:MAG: hypothetical protein RL090_717, partial [Bacteroidota bacterium]